jgi:LPS export ABC transporter protein LptC
MRNFYQKHKVTIIMFTPIFVGLAFFFYSAFSGMMTVNTTEIPDNATTVNLEISDYQIQQIDKKTNFVKWALNAEKAEATRSDTQAKISNPSLIYYEENKAKFTIVSKTAQLDQANQEVHLRDQVVLKTSDGNYTILAGTMDFKEKDEFISFGDNWTILNNEGYTIEGLEGKVNKDFSIVISKNNAKLNKQDINLKSDHIRLELKSKDSVQATGNSVLEINSEQKLFADEILISEFGRVRASGQVNVKTPELDCYSQKLEILPNADKSPKTAIFTGNPYIVQSGNSIYADKISYDFATQKTSLEGRVHSGY